MAEINLEKIDGCNILITGATGLIGSCIVDELMKNAGCHVYAAGRNLERAKTKFGTYFQSKRFHFLQYDVEKPLDGNVAFDYIIHAASNASPNFFALNPVGVIMSNIMGTKNLLDYGRTHGMKRFLYVSSGEVYGNGDVEEWKEDDSGYVDCMTMRSCYPTSKRAAETLCVAYMHQYNVDVVVARPCHTYGPGFTESDTRAFAQFVRNARKHENIVLKSKGEQYRSWLYVKDCVSAILTILLNGQNGEAYNVADKKSCITIRELAETIADIGGAKVVFEVPSDIEKQGFSVIRKAVFDISKLEALGWEPQYSLQDALMETING